MAPVSLTSDAPAPVDLFFLGNIILRDCFLGDLFNVSGIKLVFIQEKILVVGGKKDRTPQSHKLEHLVKQKRIVFGNIKVSCCPGALWNRRVGPPQPDRICVQVGQGFFQEIKSIHLDLGVA